MFRHDRQQLFIFREFPGSNHDAETKCSEAFLSFHYLFFSQVAIRRPVSAKDRLQFKPSPCWICVAESDSDTCLSPSTSDFPCQYHSIGAPYSYFIYLTSIYLTAGQGPSVKHTHISGVLGQMNEFLNWDEHLIWRRIITYFIIFENCKMFLRQFFRSLRKTYRAWENCLRLQCGNNNERTIKSRSEI
jgi:hypothetical protein